ncbi:unnamed protein product [Allacma fusca]|uniref:Transmembrane protein 192 n=1 Tax=Allacma fusca TaxID=39272 RepID=A0A8J2JIM2_9HEXA|nr:unnamed protein product [Allacma fusca]
MVSLMNSQTSFSNTALNEENEDGNSDEIIDAGNDEDDLIVSTTDGNETVFSFKTVNTIATGIFQICASIGMLIVSAVVPYECRQTCSVRPLSILLYLHCTYWGVFLICDQYIQYEHIKVRRRGYLDFYNETRTLSQLPFWIVSTWSTLLLVVSTILHDRCKSSQSCDNLLGLSESDYITMSIGLELIVLLAVLVSYIYKVFTFNQSKDPPDVLRNDLMSTSTLDFGPKGLSPINEEIFERQADLIRYYKDHNDMLRRKVLELNYRISGRTPNLS